MAMAPHIKVTALGRIDGTPEKFQYGFVIAEQDGSFPSVNDSANLDQWNDIATDVRNFHGTPGNLINAKAVLEAVKFARITEDGEYQRNPITGALDMYTVDVADLAGGGGAGNWVLPQAALCVSLQTNRYGPSGKGRMYLPMPTFQAQDDLRLSAAQAALVATGVAGLFTSVNDQPGVDSFPDLRVCVASSKGYNTPVTGVRVGRVVDTVRSRRGDLAESYSPTVAVEN